MGYRQAPGNLATLQLPKLNNSVFLFGGNPASITVHVAGSTPLKSVSWYLAFFAGSMLTERGFSGFRRINGDFLIERRRNVGSSCPPAPAPCTPHSATIGALNQFRNTRVSQTLTRIYTGHPSSGGELVRSELITTSKHNLHLCYGWHFDRADTQIRLYRQFCRSAFFSG